MFPLCITERMEQFMAAQKRHSFLTIFLIIVLCINLLNVQTVHADGEPPTEPPVPTQVETEPPTAEPTEPPTEVVTEAPTEIPTEATPAPIDSTPTAPESTPEPEGTPIAEILTQLPESTEVVVIDETGTPVPLVSEEAADITEAFDPMWCPAGVLPGGVGCTTNYSSISNLINELVNNTSSYAQNGVIYFVATTGVQTTGASLNLTTGGLNTNDFNTLNDFNLTLQGGWNGQNGASATFTGTTNFGSNSINVGTSGNPWAGNVIINDMSFNGASNNAVTVYTTAGDITLSDVDVAQQTGDSYAALLTSTSGDITIQSGSSFDGDNTGSDESLGVSATTGSGVITISDTTFQEMIQSGTGNTANGATLSAGTVNLPNVTSTTNDGNGISISNASLVTLNNVTASTNGTESGPGGINGNTGSGVFVNGTANSSVIINGGTFNNNQEYGVEVGNTANSTIYVQATPTCTGNDSNTAGLGCYNDTTIVDNTAPSITPTVTGTSGANGWYTSNVNVTWAVSDPESGIQSQSGCTASNLTSETTGVTLTCSATNNANLSHSVSVTIKIDKTAPTAALSASGSAGSNGWYTSNVTVQTTGTDPVSGVTCTGDQLFSTDTAGTAVNGSCTNGAGLLTNAAPITIKIDQTAPVVSLTVTGGTLGANNWFTSNVTVQTSGAESTSGPINCTADQFQTAETTGTNFNGSCTNQAGLTGNASPLSIKVDKTNPSITFSGRTAPNANGWNNTNVTAGWACSDPVSGPANDTVSQTLTGEGAGQSTSGTCTDLAGNSASDTQGGINIDKTAPSLSLPSDITEEATSSAGAVVSYSATVADNLDNSVSLSCTPASGASFPIGSTPVNCSSTDQADNNANGSFIVSVGDTTGPVIAAHADVTAEAISAAGATVTYTDPTATDAVEGPAAVSCAPASGGNFPLGDTTITCNATDSQNNQATPETFLVSVVDTTAPAVAFHADITVEAASASGAVATYAAPTATDLVDGEVSVACSPASGSTFPLGNTTVTCSATDAHQNTGTGTFVVHVVDTTAPQIAAAGDVTVEATSASGAVATYSSPSATDSVDGAVAVTCSPASGTTFALGNTTVTCNAMDTHNNIAAPETFVVHVLDTTAPTLNLPANITTNATGPSGAVVTYSASGTDSVDQSVAVTCSPASGSTFPLGANLVTCTGTDNFQNSTEGSFFVKVLDPGGPVLTLPDNMTVEATGPNGAAVSFSATATDLVDGNVPVTCTPASGATFDFGTTTVTCQASDSTEHTNTGAFLVTVQDTTAPAIAPQADMDLETDSASGVLVTYTSPSTTDAVDGAGVASCTPASGDLFPVGDTTITCTAADAHGNTSTSSFVVHVDLNTPGTTETPATTTSTPSGFIIPLTGGELIDLDCNSVLWAFGIKVSFYNLCDYQTTLHSVAASDLPAGLPEGFEFVMGLDLAILSEGQFIEELPAASGIQMDFPTYEQSLDQFAVLFWSEADGKWIEVTAQINADEISQTLNATAESELYQVLTESLSELFYQALTTQHTGVFILVKK